MKPTDIAKFGNFPPQMVDTALDDGLSLRALQQKC